MKVQKSTTYGHPHPWWIDHGNSRVTLWFSHCKTPKTCPVYRINRKWSNWWILCLLSPWSFHNKTSPWMQTSTIESRFSCAFASVHSYCGPKLLWKRAQVQNTCILFPLHSFNNHEFKNRLEMIEEMISWSDYKNHLNDYWVFSLAV